MQKFSAAIRAQFPDEGPSLDQYEGIVGEWEQRFERAERVAQGAERLFLRTGAKTARRLVAVQSTNLAARAVNLADGLTALVNEGNVHAIPPVGRALFETCGVATYMRRNLVPLLVKRRAERAKVMLFRLGMGSDPGIGWGRLMPYRVSAFVRSLAQDADDSAQSDTDEESMGATLQRLYADLSDHTHPNHGATHLSMTLTNRMKPVWTLKPPLDEGTLEMAIGTAYLALYFGGTAWDAVLRAAQQHPVLLPDDDHFGPGDLQRMPEATEDAESDAETET